MSTALVSPTIFDLSEVLCKVKPGLAWAARAGLTGPLGPARFRERSLGGSLFFVLERSSVPAWTGTKLGRQPSLALASCGEGRLCCLDDPQSVAACRKHPSARLPPELWLACFTSLLPAGGWLSCRSLPLGRTEPSQATSLNVLSAFSGLLVCWLVCFFANSLLEPSEVVKRTRECGQTVCELFPFSLPPLSFSSPPPLPPTSGRVAFLMC